MRLENKLHQSRQLLHFEEFRFKFGPELEGRPSLAFCSLDIGLRADLTLPGCQICQNSIFEISITQLVTGAKMLASLILFGLFLSCHSENVDLGRDGLVIVKTPALSGHFYINYTVPQNFWGITERDIGESYAISHIHTTC